MVCGAHGDGTRADLAREHAGEVNNVARRTYPGNNRLSNLRAVSQMINIQNLRGPRKDNRSGRLGVYFHGAAGKFAAEIKVPDKRIFLGLFPTRDEAYAAYLAAKQQLHEGNTLC